MLNYAVNGRFEGHTISANRMALKNYFSKRS